MAIITIFLFLCFSTVLLRAQLCVPKDFQYFSAGTTIYLSWSYEEEENCSGEAILLSDPGVNMTYDTRSGAIISFPDHCATYEIGVMPYSEGGDTGPVEYLNITTARPPTIYMDYVSITKNDTYIKAEWAPLDEATKNCFDEYEIVLTFTNYTSPLDTESLQEMLSFHRQTSTTYDIMSLEDCVNNTISIIVAPYYDTYTGQWLGDTYTCN